MKSQVYVQGSYTIKPKKFRTFQGLFLNFPGPKVTNQHTNFHRNDMLINRFKSETPGKINWINFVRKSGSFN